MGSPSLTFPEVAEYVCLATFGVTVTLAYWAAMLYALYRLLPAVVATSILAFAIADMVLAIALARVSGQCSRIEEGWYGCGC